MKKQAMNPFHGQGELAVNSETWRRYTLPVRGTAHTELTLETKSGKLDVLELVFSK